MRNLFLFGLLNGIVGIAIVRHEVLEGVLRQEAYELWRVSSRDRTKLGDCIPQAILGDIPGDDYSSKKGIIVRSKQSMRTSTSSRSKQERQDRREATVPPSWASRPISILQPETKYRSKTKHILNFYQFQNLQLLHQTAAMNRLRTKDPTSRKATLLFLMITRDPLDRNLGCTGFMTTPSAIFLPKLSSMGGRLKRAGMVVTNVSTSNLSKSASRPRELRN